MLAIDLFSGCGGMSLGFQNAGFEIAAAFDNWQPAIDIYRKNFNHPIYAVDLGNVTDYTVFSDLNPEIIIGGPPCQDFSSAGKRDETLGRANLTINFATIVANVRPPLFIMENVGRIETSKSLRVAKQLLQEAGYGLTAVTLNASLCGVPQDRKRFFLFGEMKSKDGVLEPYFQKNMANKPTTVHDYLGDSLGIEYYYRHPRSYKRRAIYSVHEPSPTIRGVNRPIPKTYKVHPGDAAPVTPSLRPLTTIERSYIQTFPRDFIFEGAKTDLEQMIGNAVPVKLAEYVAHCVIEYCHDKEMGIEHVLEKTVQLPLL